MVTTPRLRFRPALEALEGRLAPAVHTWTGAASALWSDPANWDGGAPAGDPDAELVFPPDVANRTNTNDLGGVFVRSLNFPVFASGYVISGEPLTFTEGGEIRSDSALGALNTIHNDLVLQGDLTVTGSTVMGNHFLHLRGVISGDHAFILAGPIRLYLWGANTHTGGTTLYAGIVNTQSGSALGTGTLTVYGGTIRGGVPNPYHVIGTLGLGGEFEGAVLTGPGHLEPGSRLNLFSDAGVTIRGGLSGHGSIVGGSGQAFLVLDGTNTYTGTTSFTGRFLRLDSATALPSATALTLGFNTRLELNGFDAAVGSLSGFGSVALGGGSLVVGSDNTSTSFGGVIGGEGAVTKVGAGTWTLSGNSTFTGGLTLAGGTARLTGNRAAGAGALTVADGVLEVAANVDVPGTVSNASVVVVEPGRALRAGRYEQSTGYTFLAGGTLAATEYIYLGDGGYFGGSGRLEGFVVNAGYLDVGTTGSAGTIVVAGDYAQTATGILRVELGDLGSGAYDRLDITGTAYLDGVLDVGLLDGFVAAEGDAYQVLTFGAVEGAFWFYNLPELGDGFYLAPIPDAHALYLYVARQ